MRNGIRNGIRNVETQCIASLQITAQIPTQIPMATFTKPTTNLARNPKILHPSFVDLKLVLPKMHG